MFCRSIITVKVAFDNIKKVTLTIQMLHLSKNHQYTLEIISKLYLHAFEITLRKELIMDNSKNQEPAWY